MGRPPKNSGAKATSQVVDEVDKNINLNVVSRMLMKLLLT